MQGAICNTALLLGHANYSGTRNCATYSFISHGWLALEKLCEITLTIARMIMNQCVCVTGGPLVSPIMVWSI